MAAAILDRVLERGRFIHLDGPSRRTRHPNLEEVLLAKTERLRISGTLADSAALHTAFPLDTKFLLIEKLILHLLTATAPCRAKRELRNRGTDRQVGGLFVVKTFQQPRLIPKHSTHSEVLNWGRSASARGSTESCATNAEQKRSLLFGGEDRVVEVRSIAARSTSNKRDLQLFQQDRLESDGHFLARRDGICVTSHVAVSDKLAGGRVSSVSIRIPDGSCLIAAASR